MSKVLFNSRSELDKLPFGAVAAKTKIRFGIRMAENMDVQSLYLVLYEDEASEPIRFPLSLAWCDKGYRRFEGWAAPDDTGLYWYYFDAVIGGEHRMIDRNRQNEARFSSGAFSPWQLTVYDADYTTPEWIVGGEFYHIFVDRFFKLEDLPIKKNAVHREDWGGIPEYRPDSQGEIRNDDFFGGNLDGIRQKMPYLKELGVSCIYLSPIFEAASNHKYDTGDYGKIDPSFGSEESFFALCSEAEAMGLRVICDGVFNHTGDDSIYFNRYGHYDSLGAYQSKDSPYYDWYNFFQFPKEYEAWWGIKTLPQLNEQAPSLREYLFGEEGILKKWTRLGASGWRLDVADELNDDTLDTIRTSIKSEKPDALILGEVWEDASNKAAYGKRRRYLLGKQLDSVMNYPFKNAIIGYIMTGNSGLLRETVESICENYPRQVLSCLMNGLGTHDTPRILTVLGGEEYATREERASAHLSGKALKKAKSRLQLASVLQFTLPGVPCIYYGDEAGLQGYEDPFNRRCFPWGGEDLELTEWYKKLSAVRCSSPVFAGGDYNTLSAQGGVFAFTRYGGGRCAMIAVNLDEAPYNVELPGDAVILLSLNFEDGSLFQGGCIIAEYTKV